MDTMETKVQPNSIEAEQSTLGCMLLDRDAVTKAIEIIKQGDFYKEAHNVIFKAIKLLFNQGEAIDLVTVPTKLRDMEMLEDVGGASYISQLANVPTTANVEHYAKIVEDKATRRKLIKAGNVISQMGYGDKELIELLDKAERSVFELSQNRASQDYASASDLVFESLANLEEIQNSDKEITGVSTGFKDLDRMLSGLQPSDLIIIAARPSMGKTALALNIAEHAAIKEKMTVAIFSLEMSKTQLTNRMLASNAQVDSHRMRTGQLREKDWHKLTEGATRIGESKIFIDDTPGISVAEMRAKARRIKAEHGLDLILVDYLQLMAGEGNNKQEEVSEISRGLKGIAREMGVPLVSLSQLSRACEQRQDKRPQLSDLRSSGSIEQDADVVAFIYRDDYYNPDSERAGITEIIIGKQRNGPVGTVELAFLKQFTKFCDLSRRDA